MRINLEQGSSPVGVPTCVCEQGVVTCGEPVVHVTGVYGIDDVGEPAMDGGVFRDQPSGLVRAVEGGQPKWQWWPERR